MVVVVVVSGYGVWGLVWCLHPLSLLRRDVPRGSHGTVRWRQGLAVVDWVDGYKNSGRLSWVYSADFTTISSITVITGTLPSPFIRGFMGAPFAFLLVLAPRVALVASPCVRLTLYSKMSACSHTLASS